MANPLSPKGQAAQKMLARMMAGFPPDNQSPIPPQTGGMTPWLPPYQQPGAGVAMTLPPYEQHGHISAHAESGGSLPMDRYMNPPPAQPAAAAPRPQYAARPEQPMPAQSGGQGYAGPDPMLPPEYDPNMDPRYLPEQWRGAFNNMLSTRSGKG